MHITATIPLVLYAIRKCGIADFDLSIWFFRNIYRFLLGSLLILLFASCVAVVPDTKELFAVLGLQITGTSAALIGAFIGTSLVTVINAVPFKTGANEDEGCEAKR